MNTLTLFLILIVARTLSAQHQVPLTTIDNAPPESDWSSAAYEDGRSLCMEAGAEGKEWHVSYVLPYGAPDSVTFVLSYNCEVMLFSGWNHNNQTTLEYVSGGGSGAVTVPYRKSPRRDYCVGVSVNGITQAGDEQRGTVCVNAAYAWYPTASVDQYDRLMNVQQVQWYSVEGRPAFYGTRKEIQASGLHGMFFSIMGKYVDLD